MKIEMLSLKDLQPYIKNPRINKDSIEKVKLSIAKHGFNQPIVVDQNNIICVGHTRYLAAIELGLRKVPVYEKQMTEDEFKAYNIADNKVGESSTWNTDLLIEMMGEMAESGASLLDTGFEEFEINNLLKEIKDIEESEDLMVATPTPSSKGKIRLVQIYLDDITFPRFIEMLEVIQNYMTTNDMSDTVYNSIEKVYDEIIRLEK